MNMNSDLKQLVMAVSLGCMGASPAFQVLTAWL